MINVTPHPDSIPAGDRALQIADASTHLRPAIAVHLFAILMFFLFDAIGGYGMPILVVVFSACIAYKSHGLVKALGFRTPALWTLLTALPLVSPVVLINLNSTVARRLTAAGLKMRFLGVPGCDRDAVRAAVMRESGR